MAASVTLDRLLFKRLQYVVERRFLGCSWGYKIHYISLYLYMHYLGKRIIYVSAIHLGTLHAHKRAFEIPYMIPV